jgi:uncharacterized protein involved in outer membrane biogenesis
MDTLNLDELLPKDNAQKAPTPAKNTDGRVFPADSLALVGIKATDSKVNFDAGKVIISGMEVSNVSVSLTLKNGRLSVNPLSAVVAGDKMGGNVTLDGFKKVARLKANINVK